MSPEADALQSDLADLIRLARENPSLREILGRLGKQLLRLATPPAPPVESLASPPPTPTPPPPARTSPMTSPPAPSPAPVMVKVAPVGPSIAPKLSAKGEPTAVTVTPHAPARPEVGVGDLPGTADKFDLKADGCDWHVRRRHLVAAGEDVTAADGAILDRARQVAGGCMLWMCRPDSPTPPVAAIETVARCYRNAAAACRLSAATFGPAAGTVPQPARLAALELTAAALSALRAAVLAVDGSTDPDQYAAFNWLRAETGRQSLYVARHMRLDDPADPADAAALAGRLADARSTFDSARKGDKDRAAGLNRIKYHAAKLLAAPAGSADAGQNARKVVETVAALVAGGLPPSSLTFRDLLAPVLDRLPTASNPAADPADPAAAAADPAYVRVRRAVDEFRAAQDAPPAADDDGDDDPAEPSADVRAVRAALAGRSVVLVGGDERREAAAALRDAFALDRLDWQSSRPHESHYRFESAVTRPDVAVVLLAIRFASHSYAEIQRFCDATGKPLVRLPAGYGVNRVAAEVRRQAGIRLGIGPDDENASPAD